MFFPNPFSPQKVGGLFKNLSYGLDGHFCLSTGPLFSFYQQAERPLPLGYQLPFALFLAAPQT